MLFILDHDVVFLLDHDVVQKKAEKRTPPFQSSSRVTLRQRPPGNRRRHKTLARIMDRDILGDQNGRENLINFFVVKVTIFFLAGEMFRLVFPECSLCRFGANAAALIVSAGKWFIPRRVLIRFARSARLGRSLNTVGFVGNSFYSIPTSPWSSGKCVRFDAGRSRVRLSVRSYQHLANWYCSLLTRRTVCGRAAGNTPRTHNKASEMKPDIVLTQSWRYKTTVVIKCQ